MRVGPLVSGLRVKGVRSEISEMRSWRRLLFGSYHHRHFLAKLLWKRLRSHSVFGRSTAMSFRTLFSSVSRRLPTPSTSTIQCTCVLSSFRALHLQSQTPADARPQRTTSKYSQPLKAGSSRSSRAGKSKGKGKEVERIPTNVTLETMSPALRDKMELRLLSHLARPPTSSEFEAYFPIFLARERRKASPPPPTSTSTTEPSWALHKKSLRASFPSGWNPPKKLSREAISLLRLLHRSNPKLYPTASLAERFKISPEGVRRILKGKWEISVGEAERRENKRREVKERERREEGVTWAGDAGSEREELDRLRQAMGREVGGEK